MAQQENTLGAPTEGLGQTVTFAFGADAGVPQLQLGDTNLINASVQGPRLAGIPLADGVKAQPNSPTLDFIMGVVDAQAKGEVQKRRTAAFVTGMQRAAAGEAVADIAKDQPWYANIYGDSDVVEGARVYASQTTAQIAAAEMEDAMPQLRKLGPAEAQAYFVETVNKKLSGDPATDAAIMQSMSRAMPGVMRRQTKEHYAYLQENASAQETAAFRAGAKNLQAAAQGVGPDFRTSEEFQMEVSNFKASVMPADGRDFESYQKSMAANLRVWAQEGNFHALNALRDPEPDGGSFFDILSPEQKVAVEKAIEVGEGKNRQRYSQEWSNDLAVLTMQTNVPPEGTTPEAIGARVDALNQQYSLATGSRIGLISPDMKVAMMSRTYSEIVQEQNKQAAEAARRAEKTGDAVIEVNAIRESALRGGLGSLLIPREKKDPVATEMYNSMAPAQQVKFLVDNDRLDYRIDQVAKERTGSINAALAAGVFDAQTQQAFNNYVALREANPHTAMKYYGEHADSLEGMYNDIKAGMSPAGSFDVRFLQPKRGTEFTDKQMTEALGLIGKGQNWYMQPFTGEQTLQPGQARRIARAITNDTKTWYTANGNFALATGLALNKRKQNGLEIMGGFVWNNHKGQQKLEDYLTLTQPTGEGAIPTNNVNEVVNYAVNEALYGDTGVLTEGAQDLGVFRLEDRAGDPVFQIQAVKDDGTIVERKLNGSEIYKLYSQRRERMKREASPVIQKQEELRKDVQESRVQAAGFRNPTGIKD
jgi:predicted transcriptional regulator